ncbi:MAG: threonine synthase [Actinobacteria bacterium]|nr:threonine synthase [Actinomycetota bacterium]
MKIRNFRCVLCKKEYKPSEIQYTCTKCGTLGVLEINYNYKSFQQKEKESSLSLPIRNIENSMWDFAAFLPIDDLKNIPPLKVGGTPLYRNIDLSRQLQIKDLYIKDDTVNPTSSLKDRASALVVKLALDKGVKAITCASTGNAASSLAGICASVGLKCYIFVPKTAPKAKITQLLMYGAEVFAVDGSYDDAFDLSIEATKKFGWYNRNTGYNPFTIEGKKTVSLEIANQLSFNIPDKVFVPVGDGCILSGVYKGFYDLIKIGAIKKMPKLIAVQAEGSNAIYLAMKRGDRIKKIEPNTIADSISVGRPRNGEMAISYIRASNGWVEVVSDEQILNAMGILAKRMGIFAEPAGATAFAGLLKMSREKRLKSDEIVVILVTGSGLKDIDSALKAVKKPHYIKPNIKEVEKIFQ